MGVKGEEKKEEKESRRKVEEEEKQGKYIATIVTLALEISF